MFKSAHVRSCRSSVLVVPEGRRTSKGYRPHSEASCTSRSVTKCSVALLPPFSSSFHVGREIPVKVFDVYCDRDSG